ncbi:unnamed protein product [Brassicogethes aeneus]|uniref:TWiK family of potassium channels protein 18 n=1 Tax=Brassicogethes aeneus TaxID=1431903 RepID=A0A9P0FHQ4_BRAAE|nr:unnamed protein product [Brassicogethes aeneus]
MSNDKESSNPMESPKVQTPPKEGKKVGFARPTLIIPPPQVLVNNPQTRSANLSTRSVPKGNMYGRKASVFMFDQFNSVMNTAKSGMGLGEKCAYWVYNKFYTWSRKWFTHCFLSIVILLYTVGGALMFVAIEGANEEKIVEGDIRRERYSLIKELRNLSIQMPSLTSEDEWEGEAARRLMDFESKVTDAYSKHALIVANRGDKIWTVWNAMVYCSTIYTTMESESDETEPTLNDFGGAFSIFKTSESSFILFFDMLSFSDKCDIMGSEDNTK